jgi:hypothetical protein
MWLIAFAHKHLASRLHTQEGTKSRTFSLELLAWVVADKLWELGATGKEREHRPVFVAYAAPASAARAFRGTAGRP